MKNSKINRLGSLTFSRSYRVLILLIFASTALAQTKTLAVPTNSEQRTELGLQAAKRNLLHLRHFLLGMPKGADLHNHLSGAVYAESWIRAAAEDRLCVDLRNLAFSKPQSSSDSGSDQPACGEGKVPAAEAHQDQHLFDALVDAFSMRGFLPSPGVSGHDHFFDTFAKFGGTDHRHLGEWIDEVATRAAAQNEQYLELMHTPDFSHTAAIARETRWRDDFSQLRDELLARGLRDDVALAKTGLDQAEALRLKREHCGQPDAASACHVQVRYLCQVLRGFSQEQVFAQALLCFETASADPRFVGINLVMPEDGYTAMSDYALHMRIVGFLHERYAKIHVSLHAGELAPGLVPYEGLCCHIPRIDLTHEYVRAVLTYDLHYAELKRMVRSGLEHGFLPGASLWSAPDVFNRAVSPCSHDSLGTEKPSTGCGDFLKSSERAQQQWELERRFRLFESES